MNIKELHISEKPVSAITLFKGGLGNAAAMQIVQGGKLKEHVSKTPALLICVEGEVVYEDEKGVKEILISGSYVNIDPMVVHWVEGKINSQLILIR